MKNAGDWAKGIVNETPGQVSERMVAFVLRWILPWVRLCYRPTLAGVENLPQGKPFLLVTNHSAGMAAAEIFSFLALYLRDVGAHRPLAGFVLPLSLRVPPISTFLLALGSIPSTYDAAKKTLDAGVPILIFPGGDHETLRPIWQMNKVDFGGRTGFLKIARAEKVPVVPMGIRGSHMTAPILFRSRLLASLLVIPRLIGLKRWGVSLFAVIVSILILAYVPLALPWRLLMVYLWLSMPFTFMPILPWTIDYRIGTPIPVEELFPDGMSDEDQLRFALAKVEKAVQGLVDR